MAEADPNDIIPEGATPAPGGGHIVPPSDIVPELPAKYGGDILKRAFSLKPLAQAAGQTGAQLGGEYGAATALEALGAPETGGLSLAIPPLAGAIAAGLEGIATRPKDQSRTSAFLWNAIPAGLGSGFSTYKRAQLGKTAASALTEEQEKFAKSVTEEAGKQHTAVKEAIAPPPAEQANVNRLAGQLGARSLNEPPLEGEERTAATNAATDAVLGPINRMGNRLGEPIGDAYRNLKGGDQVLSEQQTAELSDAAHQVRADLIAPAPKAAAIFRRLQQFGMVSEQGGGGMSAVESTFGGAETIGRGPARAIAPQGARQLTPEQIEQLDTMRRAGTPITPETIASMTQEATKPPTFDEIRELRQYVAQKLQTAQGGDSHALRGLQQQLDNVLVDHLPDNMSSLRTSYRGFIKNYPWAERNQLRRAGTPGEVADWLYTRDPSVQREIIHNATPDEREQMADLLRERALRKVNPQAPAPTQQATIAAALRDPLKNGIPKALGMNQQAINDLVHEPMKRKLLERSLGSPQGKREFVENALKESQRLGVSDVRAFAHAYQQWFDKLPPELQATAAKYARPIPPTQIVEAPTQHAALAKALVGKEKNLYVPKFAIASTIGTGLAAAAGAATSMGGAWMVRATLGFAAMGALQGGYNAALSLGGAKLLASMVSNPTARYAAGATIRGMVNWGGQMMKAVGQPQEQPEAPNAANGN